MTFMDTKLLFMFAAFLAIAFFVSYDTNKKRKAKILKKLTASWGKASKRKYTEEEYELISHYYKEFAADVVCNIDDITWNDLNMDKIFQRMNIANSAAGQEVLYKMLRCPVSDKDKLTEIHFLSEYFAKHEKERIAVQKEFVHLGFVKHLSLSDYIGLILQLKAGKNTVHVAVVLLLIAAFVVCFTINPVLGIGLVIAAVTVSILTYYKYKAKVEHYFVCVTQIVRMANAAEAIGSLSLNGLETYTTRLLELSKEFAAVRNNAWLLESDNVNGSLVEMLMEYVRMLTHVDLIRFNGMVKLIGGRQKEIYELYELLGKIESCISIASFRESLPYWSEPAFADGFGTMVLEEAYHPLIQEPVANSITANRHVLLTGSNASGKSTFLRTVAINALLSQAIDTSVSKKYQAPFYRIFSSMSLKDDLSNNNSYYIVEIKALKRILDAVEEKGYPVLCFVDEVLRGTNTVERIAASSEILRSLKGKQVLCFAATHDIELTTILVDAYDNYHFQEEVTENDVKFNFRISKGPATTRNAIKLLRLMGYEKQIIQAAEKQAGYFMENGNWSVNNH